MLYVCDYVCDYVCIYDGARQEGRQGCLGSGLWDGLWGCAFDGMGSGGARAGHGWDGAACQSRSRDYDA